ncbi:MAG: O-linked GlcNAc transferase-like protein [Lachnospiraceae bacterium]|nr:O-linked GlcNAc transferase-like protein [Lachnospiraceae bacterium]
MKKKHPKKGQYGYRNYHKKTELALIFSGLAAILLQLGARQFTDRESLKNILTVMAIVSALPIANVASPFLASFRYRTPGPEFYQKLSAYEDKTAVLYDLILTSKEQIMPMDGVCVHPSGVYFYCTNPKVKTEQAEAFLNDMFRAHRLDPHAKVITDEKAFFKRADSLKPAEEYEDDGSVGYTIQLLKDLSM